MKTLTAYEIELLVEMYKADWVSILDDAEITKLSGAKDFFVDVTLTHEFTDAYSPYEPMPINAKRYNREKVYVFKRTLLDKEFFIGFGVETRVLVLGDIE